MRKFTLTTPHGDRYFIHEDGVIERADMPGNQSGQWRFLYVARTDGFAFGNRAYGVDLEALADGKAPARYKNGSPRFTVADYDHGSLRVWGNTKHHGIGSVTWCRNYLPGTIAP